MSEKKEVKSEQQKTNNLLLISGPCSAETYDQTMGTALLLKELNVVDYFRAGVWKPRTRPGGFQGAGTKALEWLKDVKKETGLKIAVEVANPSHIDDCLKYGVDMIWIGARTSVNPFSVDEIARALQGVKIPVMVKNPVNPDVNLWVGVLERVINAGIDKVYAVHRGFYSFQKSSYSNPPLWEIPIELKRLMPDIPLLCDPSHISGSKNFILSICQHAIDLDVQGFMIESHIAPEKALTDSKQQITPQELGKLWKKLVFKSQFPEKLAHNEKIDKLREQIDEIDKNILDMLSQRMSVVKDLGYLKKQQKITILQIKRWSNIFKDRIEKGQELGLNSEFLKELLEVLHQESIRIQTELKNNKKKQ